MPPITEKDQLQQLGDKVGKLERTIAMLVIELRGNTDINPNDTGMLGKVKYLSARVNAMEKLQSKWISMFAGGCAVGVAASAIITFLFQTFLKK